MLRGIAASAGVGMGRAVLVRKEEIAITGKKAADAAWEQRRFLNAVGAYCAEALTAFHSARNRIGENVANIITAQIMLVTDPELHREVVDAIYDRNITAETAFSQACDGYIELFEQMKDELMQSRSADFRDIKVGLLSILLGRERQKLNRVPRGSVLIAEDIAPSQGLWINPHAVSAVVTQKGTPKSHISIIARAMGLPVVVAVEGLFQSVKNGDYILVDADRGEIMKTQEAPATGKFYAYHKAIPVLGGH